MAVAALRMQDRQPSHPFGIESTGSNLGKPAGLRSLAVFTIYIEQFLDWNLTVRALVQTAHPSKTSRQGIHDGCDSLCPKPGQASQSAVVRGGFQLLKRIDSQIVVKFFREGGAYTRHRLQQGDRVDFTTKMLQHRQAARQDHTPDCQGQMISHAGQLTQSVQAFPREQISNGLRQSLNGDRRPAVRLRAKWIRSLRLQQGCDFFETSRNLAIERHTGPVQVLRGAGDSPKEKCR